MTKLALEKVASIEIWMVSLLKISCFCVVNSWKMASDNSNKWF